MIRRLNMELLEHREVPSVTTTSETTTTTEETTTQVGTTTTDDPKVEDGTTTTATDETVQTLGGEEVETTSTEEEETPTLPPVEFGEGNFEQLTLGSKYVVVSGLKAGTAHLYSFDANGQLVDTGKSYTPFPGNERRLSAVRGAVGDVNGDGVADIAFVSGPQMNAVLRVIDSKTGKDIVTTSNMFGKSFFGGANVTLADLNADGKDEIIVSPDAGGGPRVRVFSVVSGALVTQADFFGIDDVDFRGGVRTAVGDMNGDGRNELLVAAGIGGGPRVAVFNTTDLSTKADPTRMISDFFALPGDESLMLRNGVYLTVGDLNNDGYADLIAGTGSGGGPQIVALDGKALLTDAKAAKDAPLANFFAFDRNQRSGVRVSVKDVNGDGIADLVTGTGEAGVTRVKTFKSNAVLGTDPVEATNVDPFAKVKNASIMASGVIIG